MPAKGKSFPKSERLCSRKAIDALFVGGNRTLSAFPLRVVYQEYRLEAPASQSSTSDLSPSGASQSGAPAIIRSNASRSESVAQPVTQVLISVSKRHFKHAVDRNRAKRQIREAWRLYRDILFNPKQNTVSPNPSSVSTISSSSVSSAEVPVASSTSHSGIYHLAFIWLSDNPLPTELVRRKMRNLLFRISQRS
ncbi:MAG: ribonuclease P protein component [Bacteroidales bacterium]|nr:ribonuclease P protein component [Bacteroidales bacterium]